MEPGGSMPHSQGSPIIPIPIRINPVPRIDIYFYLYPFLYFESTPTFFHSVYMTCPFQSSSLNHPDLFYLFQLLYPLNVNINDLNSLRRRITGSCETIKHIQCRSATAAVQERCRACLNAQGNHFEQHLI